MLLFCSLYFCWSACIGVLFFTLYRCSKVLGWCSPTCISVCS